MTRTASLAGRRHAALPPETGALLVLARSILGRAETGELKDALRACDSVDALCETAKSQGMLGHLSRVVETDPSLAPMPALVERLTGARHVLMARNLRQTAQLLQILDTLKESGVAAMPMKGPVWAEALYGDLASRNSVDLDLLVGRERLVAAHDSLLAWGLRDVSPFNRRAVAVRWGNAGQIALVGADRGLVVDLHWKVGVSMSPRSLTAEMVLARGGTIELLGRAVPCPGEADMLMMTCLEGTRDRWGTLMRLLDLAFLARRVPEGEWSATMQRAKGAGCERRVAVAVRHACEVFDLNEPEAVTKVLARDRGARSLARHLGRDASSGRTRGPLGERVVQAVWEARSEDRVWDGARYLTTRLFAPTAEDWASYELHDRLGPLYRLLRPGRLAMKWSRHAFRALVARKGEGDERRADLDRK